MAGVADLRVAVEAELMTPAAWADPPRESAPGREVTDEAIHSPPYSEIVAPSSGGASAAGGWVSTGSFSRT
jgi:hypothetical protein